MENLKEVKEFITNRFSGQGIKLLTCLFTAWIATLTVFLAINDKPFYELEFFEGINIVIFILLVISMCFLLFLINNEKIIALLTVIFSASYCIIGARICYDFYFLAGCCGIVSGIVYYSKLEGIRLKISRLMLWIGAAVLILAFTVIIGVTCCLKYNNFWTPCYDFGIFSQMFYYMKETGLPLVTCERDGLLSHFAVHFSPIYYLLLPFYVIFPTPLTLMIGQCAVTALGIVPLIKICRSHGLSSLASLAFGICYILYPAMAGGCNYYIHENNFLAPLILWLIYFMEKEKTVLSFVFGLSVLLIKEDAAVYVAVIALYFIFANKNYKCSVSLLLFSVIYFLWVTSYLSVFGDGVMTGRYNNYIYDEGGLFTVIKAVVQNPVYAVQQCFAEQKIKYFLQMLVPILFMPFCTKKTPRLILLIPFILINLMTNYRYQYDIMFQYGMGSGAILLYLSVLNFSDMGKKRGKLLLSSVICSAIIFVGTFRGWLMYYESYDSRANERAALEYAAGLIPNDASVVSSTMILPNLSQRREIYELERTKHEAEYYVIDLRYAHEGYSVEDFRTDEYEEVYICEGIVAVFRRITA